jgi:two-component system sensor histidine kinase UhpB
MERRRMAAELHDRVGQNLSALNINLDIALGMLSGQAAPEVRMRLADSLALVDGTAQAIENVMAELRPPLLEEYGLGAALGSYARDFSRRSGIAVEVDDPDELACGLPPENGIALFRIAQEALNNVARHADAKKARLFFERNGAELVLGIADDGRGFDVAAARLARRARWGLSTMHERAAALGGRLAVDSNPGRGTTVRATVPAGPDE